MGQFKELFTEISCMDFDGYTVQQIADQVGLSPCQIEAILNQPFDNETA